MTDVAIKPNRAMGEEDNFALLTSNIFMQVQMIDNHADEMLATDGGRGFQKQWLYPIQRRLRTVNTLLREYVGEVEAVRKRNRELEDELVALRSWCSAMKVLSKQAPETV